MWMIDMIIYTGVDDNLYIVYFIRGRVPLVIKFCLGKSITEILQSISINYSANGFTNTRPGYTVSTYLLYLKK